MSYILENKSEFERLEQQSKMQGYDFRIELQDLEIRPAMKILDAGCGSGIVLRYLAEKYSDIEIHGCDASESRVEMAVDAAKKFKNVSIVKQDITKLQFSDNVFDLVICRYALQHIPGDKAVAKAMEELVRVLKPGGVLCVIDGDGFLINLFPQSTFVADTFKRLLISGPVDFLIGRKLPTLFKNVNLSNITSRIEVSNFTGDALHDEYENMRQRFVEVQPFLEKFLGDKKKAAEFTDQYLGAMKKTGTVYFFNRFIVTGKKPVSSRLRIAK